MTQTANQSRQLIREVGPAELKAVQEFLLANKLKSSIQPGPGSLYYYMEADGEIIGTIGAELEKPYALIRAAGVAAAYRKQGIGRQLFQQLIAKLEEMGIVHFYLFSRQAGEFWSRLGFKKCTVEEVIRVLSRTPQVSEFLADGSIWTDVAWYQPSVRIGKGNEEESRN